MTPALALEAASGQEVVMNKAFKAPQMWQSQARPQSVPQVSSNHIISILRYTDDILIFFTSWNRAVLKFLVFFKCFSGGYWRSSSEPCKC